MATATNAGDSKTAGSSGFSKVDATVIMDSYRKNLEIVGLIGKMTVEVFGGVIKLQTAFFQQFMEDCSTVLAKGVRPAEAATRFYEILRDNTVKSIAHGKKISDVVLSGSNEIGTAVAARLKESVDNAKAAMK
ncbi:MAG: hypothetical protein LBS14_01345 [Holosporaceae bacterium]|jgi:hypothetical protein|nr:hypothetical protein [Holosporaceae bacterium]